MTLFDFNHPFFKPLWLRIVVVAVCAGWGTFELVSGATFWAILFYGLAGLSFHGLFLVFNPRDAEPSDNSKE